MATVSHWFGSWVSGGPTDDLHPGQPHYWIFWGFNYGDALSLSAHAVAGNPNVGERILAVEDVRVEADPSGRRLYFTVRNVGAASVPGYGIGYAMVSQ
jgi:hypothetical protein